jgi:hypothetical protein
MLVHMTPSEVHGLQALAMKHGGSLTVNPDTGLPEANFLKSLLPMLAGFALNAFVPGLGSAIGGALGTSAAVGTGIAVGGITGLATGSLSKGLMAGLGAYGGAGLGEGLMGAGAASGAGQALSVEAAKQAALEGITLPADYASLAAKTAMPEQIAAARAAATPGELLAAGAKSAAADPMAFAKANWKPIAAAALPVLGEIGTTTPGQSAAPFNPGRIREKRWDGRQFVDVANTDAGVFNTSGRSFSDPYRGYKDGGGIVALANGGDVKHYEIGGDVKAQLDAAYAAGDYSKVNDLAQTNKITAADVASTYKGFDTSGLAGLGINLFTPPAQQATTATATTESPADAIARIGREQAETARIARENLAALQPTNTTATTGGGLATLANATGADAGAGTTGVTTTGNGLATLPNTTGATTGATTTGRPTAEQAAATVATVYRNVLGRDPDPNGMAYWVQQLTSGTQDSATMYADFLKGAKANKETGNFGLSLEDAQKGYTGYSSADASNIADEWVRNVLGREVTDADRKTQWYKDAVNKEVMNTYAKAENIYNNFRDYAALQTGSPVSNLDLYQASKLMGPQAKTTVTGGGGNDVIVPSGYHLENGLIVKNVDATQHTSTVEDTPTNLYTAPATSLPVGVSGNTGPSQIGGGATVNPNRTITSSPRIPDIPVGGFTGSKNLRDIYTKGGGSLGYTSPTFDKIEDFNAKYVDRMSNDSKAAYDYLTGKKGAAYPTKSSVGQISRPYDEAVLGYPARGNLPYTYNKATGKMDVNPDYVAPGRDSSGNVTYSMSLNDIKSALKDAPLSGQALYDWAKSNNLSAQQIADATGRSLSSVYSDFRAGSKSTTAKTDATGTSTTTINGTKYDLTNHGVQPNENYVWSDSFQKWVEMSANGGLQQSYAMGGMPYSGGGLGTLGGYSDGGRLLKGPGDGVSDSIPATIGQKQQPARLADGEFVVPARIVSELGNGSTDAGAKKLYAMMDRVQRARGKTTGKNKVAANSRSDKYLPA